MSTQIQQIDPITARRGSYALKKYSPGLLLCAVAVAIAMTVNVFLPGVSPLVVAIVLGIALTNVVRLPESTAPGLTLASKKLLRLGIVFLGLQLVLSDIVSLGAPMLVVIVCIVAGGIFGTILIGRLMKMRSAQVLLIACGFSICGAAAVAGVEGVTDSDEEDVVTAVALVVIFGTLMIPAIPLLGQLLGMWLHPRDRSGCRRRRNNRRRGAGCRRHRQTRPRPAARPDRRDFEHSPTPVRKRQTR